LANLPIGLLFYEITGSAVDFRRRAYCAKPSGLVVPVLFLPIFMICTAPAHAHDHRPGRLVKASQAIFEIWELIAGFRLWQVMSREEAIEWLSRNAYGEMRLVKTADKKVGAAVVGDPQRLILAITFLTRVTA
jgi:hypothetical protein